MGKNQFYCLFSLLLLFMTVPTWALSYFKDWSIVMSGKKDGNEILSYERMVKTPQSTYSIAAITMMKNKFEGERNVDSVKDLVRKEFKLQGLLESKIGDAWRFEGWQESIRRQVVIFVSFEGDFIKVSSGFYRPFYGRKIGLEVELWHRFYHEEQLKKTSWFRDLPKYFEFISSAYAQSDCTACAGNPMCLMLCRTAGGSGGSSSSGIPGLGGTPGSSGLGGLGGLDLSGLQTELANTNTQMANLNGNLATFNINHAQTNAELATFNANHAQTNQELATFNTNHAETNKQMAEANKNAQKALDESKAWREMTEKESKAWQERADRGLTVAEKMVDPNHMFKVAAFSAAGAVIGASVANLVITGISAAVSFLWDWLSGDLRERKQEKLRQEFAQAMKVYEDMSKIVRELEKGIDGILASMELHKKFALSNSDVLANIQKYIVITQFELEDAKKDRCAEKVVELNQKMLEFQSLAKILDMTHPQKKMCSDLKDMFIKLSQAEGALQNARPNLLKAQEALVEKTAKNQNEAAETMDDIKKGKLAKKVMEAHQDQRKELYERNVEDSEDLKEDIEEDCFASFKSIKHNYKDKDIKRYCEGLVKVQDPMNPQSDFGLSSAFPSMSEDNRKRVTAWFKYKQIPMGIDKHRTYEKQRETLFRDFDRESARHKAAVDNYAGRMSLDPRIALEEINSMNSFVEKIMKEQAFVYTDGMKAKKAKFEEACIGMIGK